ncbi:exocyst complex component EXO84C isoform X2 [Triticum urartu]|uniref:Exocyst component Exo84 C-terminal domain-containing protein n=1 Tax=Triticum urartu TaxID=4572 RepID=A0A8R7TFP3_TRIUA|nr:exocyst complex component EXO84C isoform X2 [Triticum urartu]
MGRPAMESSSEEELEDDFPGHEWITPQSSIRAAYQSQTEKGIRKTCSELLELKDAIENLCGNMQSKYHAFLRISEEVVEAEQELIELQKHVSAQGMLVQDLMSGVCRELDMWQKYSKEEHVVEKDFQSELNEILSVDTQDPKVIFLDEIDILLAEHKLEKALLALDTEEKKYMTTDGSGKESDAEISAYKTALFKRKSILEDQLVRRVRRKIIDSARNDDILRLGPQEGSPTSDSVAPKMMLTSSGKKFMSVINDLLDHVTPMTTVHFGGTILSNFLQLFDRYVETLIKVLPGPSEDDNVVESQEPVELKAESDAQQLALIGTAYTVADELLPAAVSKFFDMQTKKKETSGTSEGLGPGSVYSTEYKEWKRHLQHSLDKLRDHFCRQYVLSFIYLEGKSRLDARMYLEGNRDDLFWDSDPLPSLPFQALFGRLQQLASVAGDVLLGKEKIQKVLLSRLTETVVMWLSNEQEFWDVFENESIQLQPSGLQQLILDMHFLVEIAICGRYPHRPVQQLVSVIITRAIAAFSAREVDPQSALPEDEWFLDTAKTAINKLMLGTSGSESDLEAPIAPHDDGISEDSDSISCLSSIGSEDSFASANNDDLENPVYFTDPDS